MLFRSDELPFSLAASFWPQTGPFPFVSLGLGQGCSFVALHTISIASTFFLYRNHLQSASNSKQLVEQPLFPPASSLSNSCYFHQLQLWPKVSCLSLLHLRQGPPSKPLASYATSFPLVHVQLFTISSLGQTCSGHTLA